MQVWFAIIAIVAFAFLIARAMRENAEKQRAESSHESEVTHHITEPLMGILGFMMAIIWADGEPENAQIDATFAMLKNRFRLDEDEAPQAMGAASGLLHTAKDKDALLRDLGRLIRRNYSDREIIDFDEVLVELTEVKSEPTRAQLRILQVFRTQTGVMV